MTCKDYLEDPEANVAHLASCASCRTIAEDLDGDVPIESRPIPVDALPLAPWEGAAHRTWPLVAAGVVAMAILTVVLFFAAGISSLSGVAHAVFSAVPPVEGLVQFFRHTGQAIGGPTVGLLFLVINTLLFLLLRRAPKGMDV